MEYVMSAKITLTAGTVQKGMYEIPYPRIGLYDVEAKYKDTMKIENFLAMVEEKDSTIIITKKWARGNRKTVKLSGDVITITDGDIIRTYAGISKEQIDCFYTVAKATKNSEANFRYIKNAASVIDSNQTKEFA